MASLSKSQEAGDALRLRLAAPHVAGNGLTDAWDGDAKMLNLKAIFALRRRFPEAQLFLWQTSFSSDAFHGLCEPLASESYFDPARPLRRLLLKLDLQTQQGAILWPAGAPGPPESRHLCGEGHRWACVCFLRPAWRDPRVLLHKERPLVHRCQELNGELLLPSGPLRVALAVYRADDDEGPDDPAAENFRGLCTGEYGLGRNTKKRLSYEGCQIFRSVKNFMIQTGDFQFNNGDGGESIYGGTFNDEDFVRRHTQAGVVSMANKGLDTEICRNSNGSQFFITLKRSVQLDNKHIAFGQVVEGMDVIRAVAAVPTDGASMFRSVDATQDRDERPRVSCTIVGCGEVGAKTQSGVDFHTEMSKQIQNLTEDVAPKANAAQQGKQILAGKPGGAATGNEISGTSLKRKAEEETIPSETAGLPPPKTERERKLYELRLKMNQGRVANNKEVIEEQKRESDPGYSKKMAARPSWLTRIPIAAEQGPTAKRLKHVQFNQEAYERQKKEIEEDGDGGLKFAGFGFKPTEQAKERLGEAMDKILDARP
eukprot:g30082.t1